MGNQKNMRARINEYREENRRLQERRMERIKERMEAAGVEAQTYTSNRESRRMMSSGTPRSVVFSQKMTIPKGRR